MSQEYEGLRNLTRINMLVKLAGKCLGSTNGGAATPAFKTWCEVTATGFLSTAASGVIALRFPEFLLVQSPDLAIATS